MTNLETALSFSTGLETTIEELDNIIIKGDIGLNNINGIESVKENLVGIERYEYETKLRKFGHASKYFY